MSEQIRPDVARLVGDRIRTLRTEQGLSVVGLAERSGVSRRMLTQVELGQANPSLSTVDKIAGALGTSFATLVGVQDRPAPDGVEVWSTTAGSWAYLVNAVETPEATVELWTWHLVRGDSYGTGPAVGAPPSMVHVSSGEVRVRAGDAELRIGERHSARLDADQDRAFEAVTPIADFVWVVTIPRRPGRD
ncbi:helix-turn-helix domain-containing protein [Tersicoccus sp. Bi-70]|uniref:helix-turn-helix domain-containing protein n=1 Tax=Tersicoccus sp. Bi-70 TaxID=1897634 RepID=UPI000975B526|nr:helix-turn-helix transcriptional regulator [Tersicoccus sp. Bi-70]OMH34468.1 transcriptional regulator [Tersicoccus sp. Bi-70]